ncbi:DNA internalization-related competence protein ComEC/Rec2 [Stieleria varia]|uniref:DNA internalization-related competence protein ComEC/Rec2 n=1 Tax=Stieleria varia TaxID=2528005 RepID=UPI001E4AC329|nr:DNA internalization-related competence protein ComEC/Rec2 [Stieleria varia]
MRSSLHRFPLLWAASFCASAVVIDSLLMTGLWVSMTCWSIVLVAAAVAGFLGSPTVRAVAVFSIVGSLAGMWHAVADHTYRSKSIASFLTDAPEPSMLRGRIVRPVSIRRNPMADSPGRRDASPWQSQIDVELDSIRVGMSYQPTDGRVLVFVDDHLGHRRPGDRIEVYGIASRFKRPTNPGEPDMSGFYRRRGLHGRVDVRDATGIVVLQESNKWFARMTASIASHGRDALMRHAGEESGPLAVALVVGQREFVDHDTRDALLETGTAHLLSVSGLHLAIIVLLASGMATMLQMGFKTKFFWLLAVCVLYVAITGNRPPVMRAAVLVAAVLLSMWVKRPTQPLNTLAGAALVLIIANPENVFSVGVHLSFLAVVTLMLCGQRPKTKSRAVEQTLKVEERFDALADGTRSAFWRYGKWTLSRLGQMAWFSGCVSMVSLPLVWQQFHLISWVSVATNVLLTPGLFVALPAGVLTVIASMVGEPLAVMPGWVCDLSLRYMRWVIEAASAVPQGHAWLPSPPTWWVIILYVALASSLAWKSITATRLRILGMFGWILVGWWLATTPTPQPAGSVEATFLDVGHGTSVILRTDDGRNWLYDCGHMGNETNGCRDIDTALWSLGITHLDGVFLSHADSDHYNALPGLLRRFSVAEVITPQKMLDQPEIGLQVIRQSIQRHAVFVRQVVAGQEIAQGMQVLHPSQRIPGSDNANSLVLQIDREGTSADTGRKSLTLPGDLEPPGTEILLNQPRPDPGGVLMAPHHGSLTMDAESVLRWSRPRHVVVSGGRRAGRPEVAQMLMTTGSEVHVTATVGAVRVRLLQSGEVEVTRWRDANW